MPPKTKEEDKKKEKREKPEFTSQQINYFREVFNVFDPRREGGIPTSQTGEILRCLGQFPTDDELKKLIKKVDSDGSGTLEFDEFVDLMIEVRSQYKHALDADTWPSPQTYKTKEEQMEEIAEAGHSTRCR